MLDAAVEEVRHVCVLLGLRYPQIAQIHLAHDIGKNILQRLWRGHDCKRELLVIAGHAYIMQVPGNALAWDRRVQILSSGKIAAGLLV